MAFIAAGRTELQGRDLIWMIVLGAAARSSVTVEDVCRIAVELGGPLWPANPSLVAACVDEMLRGGNLRVGSPRLGGATRIVTTAAGLETLAMLSLAEVPPPQSAIGQVARRVRDTFDEVLPPDLREAFPGSFGAGTEAVTSMRH